MAEQLTVMQAAPIVPPAKDESVPTWALQLLVDVAVIKEGLTPLNKNMTDHETRIRALERRAWALAGAAALAGAGLSWIGDTVTPG